MSRRPHLPALGTMPPKGVFFAYNKALRLVMGSLSLPQDNKNQRMWLPSFPGRVDHRLLRKMNSQIIVLPEPNRDLLMCIHCYWFGHVQLRECRVPALRITLVFQGFRILKIRVRGEGCFDKEISVISLLCKMKNANVINRPQPCPPFL